METPSVVAVHNIHAAKETQAFFVHCNNQRMFSLHKVMISTGKNMRADRSSIAA
jgi:hypothetical protein